MRTILPYIKLLLAGLLLAFSLTAALWEYKVSIPRDRWSKIATTPNPGEKTIGYQMMVYVDRPIRRSDQTCNIYLRVRNVGRHPLELRGTYLTNRYYSNGSLYGEEIGDWQMPNPPLKLLPGAVKDVLFKKENSAAGFYGFQFNGYGLQTNTVTMHVLPSRPFWLVMIVIAVVAMWRAWPHNRLGRSNH